MKIWIHACNTENTIFAAPATVVGAEATAAGAEAGAGALEVTSAGAGALEVTSAGAAGAAALEATAAEAPALDVERVVAVGQAQALVVGDLDAAEGDAEDGVVGGLDTGDTGDTGDTVVGVVRTGVVVEARVGAGGTPIFTPTPITRHRHFFTTIDRV